MVDEADVHSCAGIALYCNSYASTSPDAAETRDGKVTVKLDEVMFPAKTSGAGKSVVGSVPLANTFVTYIHNNRVRTGMFH